MRPLPRLVALSFLLIAPLGAQRRAAAPTGWAAFVQRFDAYVAGDSVVGASVLVMRDGIVLAHHETGFADRAGGIRTSEQTIYHWGSITKTLTAVAVLQLRDRGLLTLDDPVTRWVPELRLIHNAYGSMDAITVRMLLSHAAGFQDPTWPYTQGKPWEPFEPTRWEQLVAMMPYQEIHFPPDSRYSYSNPAFIYLARIVEALTGDPWQSYVYKNIWGPLGLTRSYFGATPWHLAPWRSHNYTVTTDSAAGRAVVRDNGADFDPGITIPNGGWNAPLGDLATYLAWVSGAAGGDSVLARATLEEMWRGRHATDSVGTDSIGLSFFILHRGSDRFVGHTGSQAGFRAFFYINPRTRAVVIAAFNTENAAHPDSSAAGFRSLRETALELLR